MKKNMFEYFRRLRNKFSPSRDLNKCFIPGDEVWLLQGSKLVKGHIISATYSLGKMTLYEIAIRTNYTPRRAVRYEADVFSTKEELANMLLQENND